MNTLHLEYNPPAHAHPHLLPDQAAGIRFISFRNEQAAGYAAAAAGFLTGAPGVLLTVSGPGAVHGIAGLSHAQVNCWPLLMLSGSAEQVRARPLPDSAKRFSAARCWAPIGSLHASLNMHLPPLWCPRVCVRCSMT